VFLPLPIIWFGNAFSIIYYLVSSILLVNLLIAMMGATFDTLQETIRQKWFHLKGELLLHYERFVLMPPPFNTLHLILYGFGKICCRDYCFVQKRWRLIGKWSPDEAWKSKQKLKLRKERERLLVGGINKHSAEQYVQSILDKIEDEINVKIEEETCNLVSELLYYWNKKIKEESDDNTIPDDELSAVLSDEDIIDRTMITIERTLLNEYEEDEKKKKGDFRKIRTLISIKLKVLT